MRIYYDTEFTTLDPNIDADMISVGFVAENGAELYIEITDFCGEDCSDFVKETVLPLLGKGDTLPKRMAGGALGLALCEWLAQFGSEPIEFVSDSSCDWWLLLAYAKADLNKHSAAFSDYIWLPSDSVLAAVPVLETELRYWHAHPGMRHHALYDARCLKLKAERQRELLG